MASIDLPSTPPAGLVELQRTTLPDKPLRGYGSLGGEYVAYGAASTGPAVSILLIRCADSEKAAVALAKYRSDLRCLKGVTESSVSIPGNQIPIAVVTGQGEIAAARTGDRLVIVSAKGHDSLLLGLAALNLGAAAGLDFAGAAQVPMYMDKLDRWAMGFWFPDPFITPDHEENTYDVRERLDWAKKMGVSLQFCSGLNQTNSAEGILEDNGKRWAIETARDMGIPAFIQMQGAATPGWIARRHGEDMQYKVPDYVGSWYGINGNNGFSGSPLNTLGWASVAGKNDLFANQYQAVARYKDMPNVTGYGEWHGEIGEGVIAMLMDYGPVADARYRDFLREKYRTPHAVDQRWSGGKGMINKWTDVRMPEPANFLGFGPQAVDLHGEWRLCEESLLPADQQQSWGAVGLNDESWRKLIVPGDDHQLIKAHWRVPTIFRRSFDLSGDQLARLKASGGKTWLYVFTLQLNGPVPARAFFNGKPLPDQPLTNWASWVVFDVSGLLQSGSNTVALSLPWGEISYRVYLSPDAPVCYPGLGTERNAQWVDYRDFIAWMREDCLRRSIEAIRRLDPDKFIKLYAPGAITDVMKSLAQDYGCYFHDTGGMAGNWQDQLPGLMRSSGMPMSGEPGNHAYTVPQLRSAFGHWLTEGLNQIDYFPDIGQIMWIPDQRAWFEAHQPLIHLLGKYHCPEAEVAVLDGARSHRLTGFPWDHFDLPILWNTRTNGVATYGYMPNPRDLINETDVMRGNIGKYKVIADDATLVMDNALIDKIEQWVRAGGIFITQGQTGRHSPEKADNWYINRLTGYLPIGDNDNSRVSPIPGQPIFTDPAWYRVDKNGLSLTGGAGLYLQKVAPECQDILKWSGTDAIAMGVRPLGKGKVITMGSPMANPSVGWPELLKWCGVTMPDPPTAPGCRVVHFVSNNGLYDIYLVWAEHITDPTTVTLTVPGAQTAMLDVLAGATVTGTAAGGHVQFAGLKVEPLETYAFMAPRQTIAAAPLAWLKLQRDWWAGTKKPAPAPVLKPWRNTLSLDANWAFEPVPAETKDVAPLTAPGFDDTAWTRMDMGIWYPKFPNTTHGIFRRHFTMPARWIGSGRTWLWVRGQSPGVPTLPPHKMQVFLDGQPVTGGEHGYTADDLTERLTAGDHTIAVATETLSVVGGVNGNVWLEHVPEPAARQSLSGDWGSIQLPGTTKPYDKLERQFTPDSPTKSRRAMLYIEVVGGNLIPSIYLNGRLMNRDFAGTHAIVDLTPYLLWGQPNSITLNVMYPVHPTTVKTVELRYYDPGTF